MIEWALMGHNTDDGTEVEIWHGWGNGEHLVTVVIDPKSIHAYYTWHGEANELGEGTIRIAPIAGVHPLEPKQALIQIYSAWAHKNNPVQPNEPFMVFRDPERKILWEVWDVQ